MNARRPLDELLELAFSEARAAEPTHDEIVEVLRSVRPSRSRRSVRRRVVAIVIATVLLAAGSVVAVKPTRHAVFGTFGEFGSFLSGGDPPGTPLPQGERPGRLNWFAGSDRATGAVLAQQGAVRLVAFRASDTGYACFSYGLSASECRPDADWVEQFDQFAVLLRGPLPQPDTFGRLPLFGFVADSVTRVELGYIDGSSERRTGVRHGFVIMGDPKRSPKTLTAFDATGEVVSRQDVSERQWSFGP